MKLTKDLQIERNLNATLQAQMAAGTTFIWEQRLLACQEAMQHSICLLAGEKQVDKTLGQLKTAAALHEELKKHIQEQTAQLQKGCALISYHSETTPPSKSQATAVDDERKQLEQAFDQQFHDIKAISKSVLFLQQ